MKKKFGVAMTVEVDCKIEYSHSGREPGQITDNFVARDLKRLLNSSQVYKVTFIDAYERKEKK